MKVTDKFTHLFKNKAKKVIVIVMVSLISACSSTPSADESTSDSKDPLESINRPFWTFTWDYADKYVLKPTSQAYVEYMPTGIRTGLHNAALNLNEPSAVINSLLQGKFSEAGKSTGRFLLNSTIGLFGFFDVRVPLLQLVVIDVCKLCPVLCVRVCVCACVRVCVCGRN